MRLSAEETRKIKMAVAEYLSENFKLFAGTINKKTLGTLVYQVRLFGSKTNDSIVGGDTDLLLFIDETNISFFEIHQHEIIYAIKKALDSEEKIDLIVVNYQKIANSAFLSKIYNEAIII